MDPNETLRRLRAAFEDGDANGALDLFEALDEWLSEGGFLPTAWEGGRNADRD